MIRKANLVLLAFLPLLAVAFILVNVKVGWADDPEYSAGCPNVIGTVNTCPEGWHPEYVSGMNEKPFNTCHTGDFNGTIMCCEYESRYFTCISPSNISQGLYGPVEYYRGSRPNASYPCDHSSGTCGGTPV